MKFKDNWNWKITNKRMLSAASEFIIKFRKISTVRLMVPIVFVLLTLGLFIYQNCGEGFQLNDVSLSNNLFRVSRSAISKDTVSTTVSQNSVDWNFFTFKADYSSDDGSSWIHELNYVNGHYQSSGQFTDLNLCVEPTCSSTQPISDFFGPIPMSESTFRISEYFELKVERTDQNSWLNVKFSHSVNAGSFVEHKNPSYEQYSLTAKTTSSWKWTDFGDDKEICYNSHCAKFSEFVRNLTAQGTSCKGQLMLQNSTGIVTHYSYTNCIGTINNTSPKLLDNCTERSHLFA